MGNINAFVWPPRVKPTRKKLRRGPRGFQQQHGCWDSHVAPSLVEAACNKALRYFVPEVVTVKFLLLNKASQSTVGKEDVTKAAELDGAVGTVKPAAISSCQVFLAALKVGMTE